MDIYLRGDGRELRLEDYESNKSAQFFDPTMCEDLCTYASANTPPKDYVKLKPELFWIAVRVAAEMHRSYNED